MTENAKAEPHIKMLANPQSADTLSAAIVKIEAAQKIMVDHDKDGLRAALVEPVLKLAIADLTKVYQTYKAQRKAKA
jgi:hypothetical protein